jgi:hypothetical protein
MSIRLAIFSILFSLFILKAYAQNVYHRINVEVDTSTYIPVNPDSASLIWDDSLMYFPFDTKLGIPLGFDLEWGDITIDSIDWVYGMSTMVMQEKACNNQVYSIAIALDWWLNDQAWNYDTTLPTESPILLQYKGKPGNRQLVFEWVNANLNEGDGDTVNFQIIFSEAQNSIYYHFGKIKVNTGNWFTSSIRGQAPYFYFQYQMDCFDLGFSRTVYITDNPDNPAIHDGFISEWPLELEYLQGAPSQKTRWKFTLDKTVSTQNINPTKEVNIFPNPVFSGESINIEYNSINLSGQKVKIYNRFGQLVSIQNLNQNMLKIPEVEPGIYLISIQTLGIRKNIIVTN